MTSMTVKRYDYDAFKLFFKIGSTYQKSFSMIARSVNLTKQELSILLNIVFSPDGQTTPGILMDHLGVDKTQLSRSLKHLGERGLVLKEKDKNNKKYLNILITVAGEEAISSALVNLRDTSYDGLKSLSPEEKAQIIRALLD